MRTLPDRTVKLRYCGKGALLLATVFGCAIAPSAMAAPTTHTVVIEAMQFSPQVLEVRAGDTVEWINKDPFPHDAKSTGKGFKSKVMAPNARWKFVARDKGSFSYMCMLHPMMKASIIVK